MRHSAAALVFHHIDGQTTHHTSDALRTTDVTSITSLSFTDLYYTTTTNTSFETASKPLSIGVLLKVGTRESLDHCLDLTP